MTKLLSISATLLLVSTLVGACASSPRNTEQNYLLPAAVESATSTGLPRLQVKLAGYLDQTGVVMETGATSVQAARRHLWAEPLPRQLKRALAYHLAAADRVTGQNINDQRLTLTVTRFQGTIDGNARVSGQWHYQTDSANGTEKTDKNGSFDVRQPLRKDGYSELVSRLNAAWQTVSEQIAAAIRE